MKTGGIMSNSNIHPPQKKKKHQSSEIMSCATLILPPSGHIKHGNRTFPMYRPFSSIFPQNIISYLISVWFSMIFHWFSIDFPWFCMICHGFSMDFPWLQNTQPPSSSAKDLLMMLAAADDFVVSLDISFWKNAGESRPLSDASKYSLP